MKKVVFLFLLSLLYCLIGLTYLSNHSLHDEGLIPLGAERVLNGAIPYRDFFSLYPPGSFWLLGLTFKCFGTHLVVSRLQGIVLNCLLTVLTYLLAKTIMRPRKAFLMALLLLVWVRRVSPYNYPVVPALCLLFGGFLLLERYLETNKKNFLFYMGMCGGGSALFRHELAAAFFLVLSVGLVLRNRLSWQKSLKEHLWLYGGGLAVCILPFGYFAVNGALNGLVDHLIRYPITVFPKVRFVPLREMKLTELILSVWILFVLYGGCRFFSSQFRRRTPWENHKQMAGVLFLFDAMLFFFATARMDAPYLLGAFGLSLCLGAYFFEQWTVSANVFPTLKKVITGTVVTLFLISFGLLPASEHILLFGKSPEAWGFTPSHIRRTQGLYYAPDLVWRELAIWHITFNTSPTDQIYVGLGQHRRIIGNDVLFYFEAERLPATRYHELHPGIATQESVQQEIVQDLKRKRVSRIALWNLRPHPELARQPEGSSRLDEFIGFHYQTEDFFGPYHILKSNSP